MTDCVFCDIVGDKEKVNIVYEDGEFLAFLDIKPLTKGNTLVIPKKHYRWVDDVENFGEYFEVAKKVGLAARKALGATWVSFITLGTEVPHAHIRVVPRYKDDKQPVMPRLEMIENFDGEEMKVIAKKLKNEIGGVV